MSLYRDLQLFVLDAAALDTASRSPETYAAERRLALGKCAPFVREVAVQTAAFLAASPATRDQWGAYFVVDRGTREILGTCAFVGPPDEERVVEIAYFTFPPHTGRGIATAMAANLRDEAVRRGEVARVRAHTLPERSASTRVLDKLGFTLLGGFDHPQDGTVWRWEWAPPASDAGEGGS